MSDISTKAGVFETGEKDEFGVAYKDNRIVGCYNKQLTEYKVKEGTEVICDRVFMNARDIRSISLPASVKAIGESAFAGCKVLQDINIPEGVAEIRQSVFRDCKSLGCLELPSSCVKIDKWAFSDGLEMLVCNAPEMQIDRSAFFGCKTLKTIMVPEGSAASYAQALVDCRLTPDIEELPTAGANEMQSQCINTNIISTNKNNKNLTPCQGKAGFLDENGNWVIKPVFDKTYIFKEGLARVEIDNKIGFIDKTGKMVIEAKFEDADDFYEGMARVKIDDKYGFIDSNGRTVVEPRYDYASNFHEGLAWVRLDGKYGLLNVNGEEVIKLTYDAAADFSEGLARVKINGKYGFVDTKGGTVVEPRYDYAGYFDEGLAWVNLDEKYGYINQKGEEVIKLTYDAAADFSEGLAVVKINGKYGFIDKEGKIVIDPEFDFADSFEDGLARYRIDNKYGFIDKTGKTVIEPKFDAANSFKNGICDVKIADKWGCIDKTGEFIIEPRFNRISYFKNGFAKIEEGEGQYGVLDLKGNVIIEPKFSSLSIVSSKLVIAGDDDGQGLLSMDGKWILPMSYDLSDPSEGLLPAKINCWGLVNEDGEWVVQPSYDYIGKYYPIGRNGQRLASAKKDGKWTWLDDEGKECPDAVVDYDKASKEGKKSVPAEAYGIEWFVDALNEDDDPIEGRSAFTQNDLNIDIDGNDLVVDEMNSIEREDGFDATQFCESVGAVKGILYYNKASADTYSFHEILIPEGEEFDPEKACLVTQEWETIEDDATMVTALIYDGVRYDICPGDSVGKGSVTIFGEDESDNGYGYGYEEDY